MPIENYILSVHNTITGRAEDIEVDEAVYNGYRRSGWTVKRNNDRFRENEIPFSDLKGGMDGAYENFEEFRSEQDDPEKIVMKALAQRDLQSVLADLTDSEHELLRAFYDERKSVRQVAADMGLPHMTVQSQKARLLRRLKKLLEK